MAGSRSEWVRLVRPFTLLPPLLGVVSGAVTAWGSASNPQVLAGLSRSVSWSMVWTVALGSTCAALLNAASNTINQIYDLDNDRVNKPGRPLVIGSISLAAAGRLAVALYVLAVLPTWLVVIFPRVRFAEKLWAPAAAHQCFWIFLLGLALTLVYSAPAFGRTKANAFLANLTIALPRGCLLKVAGWSMIGSIAHTEPWFLGSIFFLFLLGAASTKDFSDMKGDEAAGCRTLPIRFGVTTAARAIAPFFVFPWLLLPAGAWMADPLQPAHAILTGNPRILTALGFALAGWGGYAVFLLLRDPRSLAERENHPSWTHMYLMLMVAQVGLAIAYLV